MAAMQQVLDEVVDKVILNDEQPQLNDDGGFKLTELVKKKTCLWSNEKAGNKDDKQAI